MYNEKFFINDLSNIIYVPNTQYNDPVTIYTNNIPTYELIYCFSGEMTVHFHNTSFTVKPNTVYILPKGEQEQYWVERITHGDFVDIFFDTDLPYTHEVFYKQVSNKKIETLFKKAFTVWVGKNDGYYFECLSLVYNIFAELNKTFYTSKEQMDLIKPALKYINEKFYKEDINCENLAKICGISHAYLNRIFVAQYGMSPKKYIINLKINYACSLLKEGYSISYVSQSCGFESVYYFSRSFKKYIGITPTDYIKKIK